VKAISGRSRKLLIVLTTATVAFLSAGAVKEDRARGSGLGKTHGTLHIESFAEASETTLATHVRVRSTRLFGAEQSRLAGAGRARLSLPEGAYEVVVSHGPEWSLFTRRVRIVGGEQVRLRALLRREVHADHLTACDLHVHTNHSPDSPMAPGARATSLAVEDVDFAVITDHNRITDLSPLLAGSARATLPGIEITTWAPEFGHFNVFPRRTVPRYQATSPGSLAEELRKEPGSFVQINHPRLENHIGYFALTDLSRLGTRGVPRAPMLEAADAVEVWNGYDLGRPDRRDEVFRDWQALLARGMRLTATGNSDSHGLRAPYVGYPRTVVQLPRRHARDSQRVLAALKAGQSFVTSGPSLHVSVDGKTPGQSVWLSPAARSVRLRIEVATPSWMDVSELEVYVGGALKRKAQLPARNAAGKQSATLLVPVHGSAALIVVVRGVPAMKAFFGKSVEPYALSNPIWLRDVDARGLAHEQNQARSAR
jgi:hypothetical protein